MRDLISRQEVLKELSVIQSRPVSTAMKIIKAIPSAEKVGEWINEHEDGHGRWVGFCSNCHKEREIDNYCPNCGARMERKTDEEGK